jgi:hypothetical protein
MIRLVLEFRDDAVATVGGEFTHPFLRVAQFVGNWAKPDRIFSNGAGFNELPEKLA